MTSIPPELFYVVGTATLGAVIAYGMIQSGRRNKANDRITEEAVKAEYEHPETYAAKEEELRDRLRPS